MSETEKHKVRNRLVGVFMIVVLALLIIIVLFRTGQFHFPTSSPSRPLAPSLDLSDHPIYSKYDFGSTDNVIDFGIQPMGVPIGVILEVMRRDAMLRESLSHQDMEIRFHPFLKGADINFFLLRGDIEVATGGDMPVLTAAAASKVLVATLGKQGFNSIVARKRMLMEDLRGKRIGYPFGGDAHYTLLEALADAGLEEKDVHLISLDVTQMMDALAGGTIYAFSIWEPTPTIALAKYDDFVVIHRALSTSYLYFARSFAEKNPEAARQIVASQLRAMAWMRQQKQNLHKACQWELQAVSDLSSRKPMLSVEQCAALTKRDILDLSSAPMIPAHYLEHDGPLHREFEFLKALGKIPSSSSWESVRSSFDCQIISEVLANPSRYKLDEYSYETVK